MREAADPDAEAIKPARIAELIHSYRSRGHLMADTDPLAYRQRKHPDLDVQTHGLTLWDLDRVFPTGGFTGKPRAKLREVLGLLRDSYCRTVGSEYMHLQDPRQRKWLQERLESGYARTPREDQLRILRRLNAAEAFETFLQTKYVGQKRFSLEGGESVIALLDAILSKAANNGLDEVGIGMAHRGRLNILANIAGKSYAQIFSEFEGNQDPKSVQGSGDVKYHLGTEGTFTAESGATTAVYLAANPSHLEAVDPVLEGIVRAKQDRIDLGGDGFSVLPILIHGDAAFAGQGVVFETLNLAQLRGYRTGGTIHVIINNQVGFTTGPSSSRSSQYATDVAKGLQVPIFHVNGDDPEACVRVAELAFEYREQFDRDVIIDMVCYRRRGHNEGDDPSMTQPLMYNLIEAKRSVRKLYTETLVARGDLTIADAEQALQDYQSQLERVFTETREDGYTPAPPEAEAVKGLERPESQLEDAGVMVGWKTAVDAGTLERIGRAHVRPPEGFTVHPKLAQLLAKREAMTREGGIDWGYGELLAFGSLLVEGTPVRLAGQDSRRGTFVQRHAVMHDRETGAEWTPLLYLSADQAKFWVYDSSLSEYAALGFEYGYSVERPGRAGALGGAVRRLRQRRADDHRRVHLVGRAEVGAALVGRPAAPARVRGPGAGPLVGAHRAVPAARGRGQHDDRAAVDARVALPPAAPSGVRPAASPARGVHAEVDAAPEVGVVGRGGLHVGHVPHGHRRRPRRRQGRPGHPRAALLGQGLLGPARAPREDGRRAHGDRPARAAVPARRRGGPRGGRAVRRCRAGVGAGRAAQPGPVDVPVHAPAAAARAARCGWCPARSRRRRPPGPPRSTRPSRPTSSRPRSRADDRPTESRIPAGVRLSCVVSDDRCGARTCGGRPAGWCRASGRSGAAAPRRCRSRTAGRSPRCSRRSVRASPAPAPRAAG